ncbi:MAG TPA: amidohydrolase family protein [Porticoccaceae bacterium]|nr:amidohydrolase family protein [Pseudomonadota bacterium]HLS99029.1 amidohydrolase family protein [Porticoccaceae bacterium]
MSAELRVIDSDGHTMEPADLYDRYLDPRFRGRVTGQPAERRVDGQPIMNHPPDTIGALGFTPERIRERFGDIAPDGFTPAAVMRGQDVEGVDVSVIYGPLYDCFVEGMDPQLACAMARAYNRWMAEYAGESGGRIVGAAPIPLFDVKAALNEVEYAYHELGFRAFWTRPNPVGGRALGHADFEPLYALLESLDVPLSLHEGSGSMMRNIGSERYPDNWLEQHAVCHPMEQQMALMSLIVHGVLERHPGLRLACLECGVGWLPNWLHRLDEHLELVGWRYAPELTLAASDYFRRQCFISAEPDDILLYQVVDYLGDDNILFGTDFPHPDAQYPHALSTFLDMPKLSRGSLQKALWDNALRFYGFDAATLPVSNGPAWGDAAKVHK